MKLVIKESKIKSLIDSKLNYDLTNRIEMITSWDDLSNSEQKYIFSGDKQWFNSYLNYNGPMYRFLNIKDGDYIYQNQGSRSFNIVNTKNGRDISYNDFIDLLNVPYGIDIDTIIDLYFEE